MPRTLRILISLALAFAAGALGVLLVFMDVGPTETELGRVVSGIVLFVAIGLALGWLNPEGRGWVLAGLAAWGLVLLGSYGLWLSLTHPPSADLDLALTFLLGPVTLALLGGWLGARFRRARASEVDGGTTARA